MATLLKALLHDQHLQTYELFKVEYIRAAARLEDPDALAPSRSQFRRWLSGDLKKLPHARSCRVLLEMFPDFSADELFGAPVKGRRPGGAVEPAAIEVIGDTDGREPGRLVDLHTQVRIDIDVNGHAVVTYVYETLNLTDRPIGRVPRTVWFEHTHDEITVTPVQFGDHQVRIEMLHETEPQKKFAYRLSPPVEPGGRVKFGCEIRGGAFVDELYWRHLALRDTELMTMEVVHQSHTLSRVIATEEMTDGSEELISKHVEWSQDESDLRLRLQRRDLEPTQVITLRWEINEP